MVVLQIRVNQWYMIYFRYAYLMESIPLRYQLSQHCDLMEVGGELDSKGYGIGVPKDSPYRDSLSNAILNLSEMQILLNLYNKWWNVSTCVLSLTCLVQHGFFLEFTRMKVCHQV